MVIQKIPKMSDEDLFDRVCWGVSDKGALLTSAGGAVDAKHPPEPTKTPQEPLSPEDCRQRCWARL
jgi:hypothetical protein